MEFIKLLTNSDFWALIGSIFAFIGTVILGVIRWVLGRFDQHGERISQLERDFVNQEEFDKALSEIYRKMDDGFRHLNNRFDELMRVMISRNGP